MSNIPKLQLHTEFYQDVVRILEANNFGCNVINKESFMVIEDDLPIMRLNLYTHPSIFRNNIKKNINDFSDKTFLETEIMLGLEKMLVVLNPLFRTYNIQDFLDNN
jgi:hypothetical protein